MGRNAEQKRTQWPRLFLRSPSGSNSLREENVLVPLPAVRQGTPGDTALPDEKERQDKAIRMTHLLHFLSH